jgi:hypothetical protein
MRVKINLYSAVVGKPQRKKPLGRHRRRWKGNVAMDLKCVWEGVELINVSQNVEVWRTVMNKMIKIWVL